MRRRCKCGEPLVRKRCYYCGLMSKRVEEGKIRGLDNKTFKSQRGGGGVLSFVAEVVVEVLIGGIVRLLGWLIKGFFRLLGALIIGMCENFDC